MLSIRPYAGNKEIAQQHTTARIAGPYAMRRPARCWSTRKTNDKEFVPKHNPSANAVDLLQAFQRFASSRTAQAATRRVRQSSVPRRLGLLSCWRRRKIDPRAEKSLTQPDSSRTIVRTGPASIGVGSVVRRHMGQCGVGANTIPMRAA